MQRKQLDLHVARVAPEENKRGVDRSVFSGNPRAGTGAPAAGSENGSDQISQVEPFSRCQLLTLPSYAQVGLLLVLFLLLGVVLARPAAAATPGTVDAGDTAFMLVASALVMLMTPGLALFYGGMVRQKNVLSIIVQCLAIVALISVQWVLWGYSLAFGPDHGHLIGGLSWLGFRGVGLEPNANYAATVPHQVFAMFQLMFAIITPALITGSFAERMRFPAFLLFTVAWATLVYDPLAHWVWGTGGWLRELGALDFAGGTVVHISAGVAGLVSALVLGRRRDYGRLPLPPHNLPMTVLGAALLWFGWFGFNAGSALGANGLAGNAFVTTNTAAGAATLGWLAVEWLLHGKPTALGAASGAVAGLVAITPAAGFVTPLAALVIGGIGGALCCLSVSVTKAKLGYDDALDAFGCHGVGGTWGAIATGIFATTAVNPTGASGLLYGNPRLLAVQVLGVVAAWAFTAVVTYGILKAISLLTPLRVTAAEEETGLDLSLHGESAYPDTSLAALDIKPAPAGQDIATQGELAVN